jgi:hypothetical protein
VGLLDIFGKGKPLTEAQIAKLVKQLKNQYAQPDVRREAMQKLYEQDTPAAVAGLLQRFTVNTSGNIADEEEKLWVEDALVDFDETAIQPIKDFIRREENITYPIRALLRIIPEEQVLTFLVEVLEHYGPDDYRSYEIKLQVLYVLAEKERIELYSRLMPFLHDHADDVRLAVMDMLYKAGVAGKISAEVRDQALAAMADLVLSEGAGPRIQRRACEIIAELEWRVPGEQPELAPLLSETYYLDKKRYIRKRVQPAVKT